MNAVNVEVPTLDFDHHSSHTSHERDDVLALVRPYPVFWTESYGGHWVVTSHELVKRILKDPATFSSGKSEDGKTGGVNIPPLVGPGLLPGEADGAKHVHLRRILAPRFTKSAADRMRPAIEALITRTIDRIVEKGDFDVVHDISEVVPAGVMVEELGLPDSERLSFIKSIQVAFTVLPKLAGGAEMTPEMQEGIHGFERALDTIRDLIVDSRANPKDNLASYLVRPEHELSDDDLLWVILTLIAGGAENPAALLSNAMVTLAEDRDLRERLIAEPSLRTAAIEEFLRHVSAGVSVARTITRDVEIGDAAMKAGQTVLCWLPAANRDPAVFDNPDAFDVDRPRCPHLAFGDGPHFCPGSTLVRLEFDILFEQILTRIPNFSVDLTRSRRFDDAGTMYGYWTIPAKTNL